MTAPVNPKPFPSAQEIAERIKARGIVAENTWRAHVRITVEERDVLTAAVAQAKEEEKLPQRLYDLIRFCRTELHNANLITDEEYTEMCSWGAESARRLEDYDAALKALELKEPATESNLSIQKALQRLSEINYDLWAEEGVPWRDDLHAEARDTIELLLSEHSNAAGAAPGKQEAVWKERIDAARKLGLCLGALQGLMFQVPGQIKPKIQSIIDEVNSESLDNRAAP